MAIAAARAPAPSPSDPADTAASRRVAAAPFALVSSGAHGLRLSALNASALAEGLRIGQPLNDARAAWPALITRAAEPGRDRAALIGLARWCGRYGPGRNRYGADGIWIDSTGVAHLYGGEQPLLDDLVGRLGRLRITARAAMADTFGAAYALARFAASHERPAIVAARGDAPAAIGSLPVESLRLDPGSVLLLKRLGLRRIAQLSGLPRPSLARRFRDGLGSGRAARAAPGQAMAVLARLDQAEGRLPEPMKPLAEPPDRIVRCSFPEPLLTGEGVTCATASLAAELCATLAAAGEGARRFTLGLYRADGTATSAGAGTSRPCRDPRHVLALLSGAMDRLDAGFGIDMLTLAADRVEPLAESQTVFVADGGSAAPDALPRLIDRLSGRLGAGAVSLLASADSHLPERACRRLPALVASGPLPQVATGGGAVSASRPPFFLEPPEPIAVLAEVPEGAPLRFTWRRLSRHVVHAEGPERIAPEWWREIGAKASRERDYYRLEDTSGGRYWVFRSGRYGRDDDEGTPAWFMHGLFA